jgi:hypothetical protein
MTLGSSLCPIIRLRSVQSTLISEIDHVMRLVRGGCDRPHTICRFLKLCLGPDGRDMRRCLTFSRQRSERGIMGASENDSSERGPRRRNRQLGRWARHTGQHWSAFHACLSRNCGAMEALTVLHNSAARYELADVDRHRGGQRARPSTRWFFTLKVALSHQSR